MDGWRDPVSLQATNKFLSPMYTHPVGSDPIASSGWLPLILYLACLPACLPALCLSVMSIFVPLMSRFNCHCLIMMADVRVVSPFSPRDKHRHRFVPLSLFLPISNILAHVLAHITSHPKPARKPASQRTRTNSQKIVHVEKLSHLYRFPFN